MMVSFCLLKKLVFNIVLCFVDLVFEDIDLSVADEQDYDCQEAHGEISNVKPSMEDCIM